MTKIQIVLSDDWELRGNGSGDMRVIQFEQMKKLVNLYEQFGLKGTFNAEVMQQLYHLKFASQHSELLELANEWEELVKQVYSKGHDIQLHIHSQWLGANYENQKWTLNPDWSILNQPESSVRSMITEGKSYLENLLSPINKNYQCVSFRSGAWCAAPSEFLMQLLADNDFVFDTSITEGLVYDLDICKLDYRNLEEPFLPYYPNMHDARQVSAQKSAMVCVPTHAFKISKFQKASLLTAKALTKFAAKNLIPWTMAPASVKVDKSNVDINYSKAVWETGGFLTKLLNTQYTSDLAQLSYQAMRMMLKDIRKRAKHSGWNIVPVVLENHTKDIGDFRPLQKFYKLLANSNDIEVITATKLAENIRNGLYKIKCK